MEGKVWKRNCCYVFGFFEQKCSMFPGRDLVIDKRGES